MQSLLLDLLARVASWPEFPVWPNSLFALFQDLPDCLALAVYGPVPEHPGCRGFLFAHPRSEPELIAALDWQTRWAAQPVDPAANAPLATGFLPDGSPILTIISPMPLHRGGNGLLILVLQPLPADRLRQWSLTAEHLADLLGDRFRPAGPPPTEDLASPRVALDFLHEITRILAQEPVLPTSPDPALGREERWMEADQGYLHHILSCLHRQFELGTVFAIQRITPDRYQTVIVTADHSPDGISPQTQDWITVILTHEGVEASIVPQKVFHIGPGSPTRSGSDALFCAGYPCEVGGVGYGHLGVLMPADRPHSAVSRLLTILANHLGFWFSHHFLLRQEESQARILKQINLTCNVINTLTEIPQIVDQLCSTLADLFGQKAGAIVLFSRETRELEAFHPFGPKPDGFDLEAALHEGRIRETIQLGAALNEPSLDAAQPIRLVFPLSAAPQVISDPDFQEASSSLGGLILYNHPENRQLSERARDLLTILLNGVGATLQVVYKLLELVETIQSFERLISKLTDLDQLIKEMIDIIRKLLKVNRVSFLTPTDDGSHLEIRHEYGLPPGVKEAARIPVGEGISGWVFQAGKSFKTENIESEGSFKKRSLEDYFNRSLLSVPLVVEQDGERRVLGVINVNNKTTGLTFTEQDQVLLESIARLAVAAIGNDQRQKEKLEQDRLAFQLETARNVQMALLPKSFPNIPSGLDMAGRSDPARQIGGDFFDGLPLDDGRWLAAIGDVSGKGIPAAILMATTRIILRTVVQNCSDPVQILERINETLSKDLEDGFFVTLQIVALDPHTGEATMASAGHGPLMTWRDGQVSLIEARRGVPLGFGGISLGYEPTHFRLKPGDGLFFFTDGLSEERDRSRRMFGTDQVRDLYASHATLPAKEIVATVFDAAIAWRDGGEAHDDLTVMVLTFHPTP